MGYKGVSKRKPKKNKIVFQWQHARQQKPVSAGTCKR